mgnify:CR=1 FL=1
MNTDTGALYRTPEEIAAAAARGERIVTIGEEAARVVEAGHEAMNRHERRRAAKLARQKLRKGK